MAMECWPSRSKRPWASRWEASEKRGLAPNCIRASDSASKRPGHHRIARFIAVQRTIVSGRFREEEEEEVLDVSKKALAQLNVTPRGGYFERRTNGWNRPKADVRSNLGRQLGKLMRVFASSRAKPAAEDLRGGRDTGWLSAHQVLPLCQRCIEAGGTLSKNGT